LENKKELAAVRDEAVEKAFAAAASSLALPALDSRV